MVLTKSPLCEFGTKAPAFRLPGIDDRFWTLDDCMGPNGLLVMFICNHCPYVKAINHKLVRDAKELDAHGICCVAIMPNDVVTYPEDSMENMRKSAEQFGYPFPYLLDESQHTARSYGAICTPDFFGYNANLELQYRGRLDECGARREPDGAKPVRRDLFLAMKQIAETGTGPKHQFASMGCSIKWR